MKKLLIILLAIIPLSTIAQDYEMWGTFNLDGKISDRWSVHVEQEDRYNFDNAYVRYIHTEFGFLYTIKDFKVGLFYRDIFERKDDGHHRVTVPYGDVIYSKSGFKFRTRIEYIKKYEGRGGFRFRFRPGYQAKIWDNFNPFIQNELFVTTDNVVRNRLNAGVTIKVGKFHFHPGYLWETNQKDVWTNKNILWVNMKIKI